MADLTAALYVEHAPDRVLADEALRKVGKKVTDFSPAWRNQRIRRTIADGATIQAAALGVLQKYRGQMCLATGEAVVTAKVEAVYQQQGEPTITIYGRKHSPFDLMTGGGSGCVRRAEHGASAGCVLMPRHALPRQVLPPPILTLPRCLPGCVPACPAADVLPLDRMYKQRAGDAGTDSYGLRVFWCYRGSSSEEGMHGHLNQLIKGGNTGPELAQVRVGQSTSCQGLGFKAAAVHPPSTSCQALTTAALSSTRTLPSTRTPPQVLIETWFYRRAVDAIKKAGQAVPHTYELALVEAIQGWQAALGVPVEYPGWTAVPRLSEPLPAFGLEFCPPLLQHDSGESRVHVGFTLV